MKFNSRADQTFYKFDREAKLKSQRGKCFYCGLPLTKKTATVDHVIPLSKLRGKHSNNNTVIACEDCNVSKADGLTPNLSPTKKIVNAILMRIEKRTQLAVWRLSFKPMGSFKKWCKHQEKANQ